MLEEFVSRFLDLCIRLAPMLISKRVRLSFGAILICATVVLTSLVITQPQLVGSVIAVVVVGSGAFIGIFAVFVGRMTSIYSDELSREHERKMLELQIRHLESQGGQESDASKDKKE